MYLRHEGVTSRSFIPEDDKRTSTMAGTLRHADPVTRNPWVVKMPAPNRMDALVRQYIYDRVEKCEAKREKLIWRSFLKAVNAVTNGENPARVAIAIRKGEQSSSVEVYAAISGVGRVMWLPAVTLQANGKLSEIMRECGPNRVKFTEFVPTSPSNGLSQGRTFIPPTIEITLIPGRKS